MKFRHILTAAALAAAVFPSAPAAAQRVQADTLLLSTALWTGCPGMTVRVTTLPGDTVTGRCGRVEGGRLAVRTGDAERPVQLAEVRSLEVRKSRIAETAVILSLLGAVVGQSLGLEDGERICFETPWEPHCVGDNRDAVRGRGAAVGAVVGAAAGLFLGSRLKYWQHRYP